MKIDRNSTFNIQHLTFNIPRHSPKYSMRRCSCEGSRRRKGSGGSRGLQNRCFGAEASKGWFDSDAPPPASAPPVGRWNVRMLDSAGGWGHPYRPYPSCPSYILLRRRVRQKPDLGGAALVRGVHGRDGLIERHLILGVNEDHLLIRGAAGHLRADEVRQLVRAGHLLRVQVDPIALDRHHQLVLFLRRRRALDLHLRRHLHVQSHLQDRRGHHEDDEQHQHHVDQRRDVDLAPNSARSASAEAHYVFPFAISVPACWFSVRKATAWNSASLAAFITMRTLPKLIRLSALIITARPGFLSRSALK